MIDIIFFHVPKCGGTSVERQFEKIYGLNSTKYPATILDYIHIPPKDISKFKVLAGHITHDIAISYTTNSTKLITLLRKPSSRLRSFYNYFKTHDDQSLLFEYSNKYDFKQWLNCGHSEVLVQIQNSMIRQFTPESFWNVHQAANPDLMLHRAREYISTFDVVGTLERIERFNDSVGDLLGCNFNNQLHENKSKIDYTHDVSTAYIDSWIRDNSILDLLFYEEIHNNRLT
jgi:hypothetical protein